MSSVLEKSMNWLGENFDEYKEVYQGARHLFFDLRENGDLPDIDPKDSRHEMFFNEWLLLDFSVYGYNGIPVKERKNFLDIFLEQKVGNLSENEVRFTKNLSRSVFSLYEVIEVEKDFWVIVRDTFREDVLYKVYDFNLSSTISKKMFIMGRVVKEKPQRHIFGGSMNIPLEKGLLNIFTFLFQEDKK